MPPPAYGQITTTGSAQQVDPTNAGASCTAFELYAPLTNSATGIFLGDSSVTQNNGFQLDPGNSRIIERTTQNNGVTYTSKPSDFYVRLVTSGDKLCWWAIS